LRSWSSFWDFSGWFQKSGEAICSSIRASWDFLVAGSKIAPHGFGLPAERKILAFQILEGHLAFSLAKSSK
jgi:hypothetical protein